MTEGRPVITLGVPLGPFRPTCPHEDCAVLCEPISLYCAECGTRLYEIGSGRYGALDDRYALREDHES